MRDRVEVPRSVPGDRTTIDACPFERRDVTSDLRFWRGDHSIPDSGAFGISKPTGG